MVFGFTGWSSCHLTSCKNRYFLPRELSLSNDTGPRRLLQHPAKELVGLRRAASHFPAVATGSQIEVWVVCDMPSAVPTAGMVGVRTMARPAPSPSPHFVPGLPHIMLIEWGQALLSYQDYHTLC